MNWIYSYLKWHKSYYHTLTKPIYLFIEMLNHFPLQIEINKPIPAGMTNTR